jgi:S-formylglutathione hydrolase FrmB
LVWRLGGMRYVFIFLSFISACSFSYGEACKPQPKDKGCFTCTSPVKYSYCITQDETSHNPDVLYHLHGLTLDEKAWRRTDYYPEMIRQVWKYENLEAPTVVSVSFGPVWLLVEKNASKLSGLFEVFLKAVIPQIEASLGGVKGKRLLIGESMGGFNATQLLLKAPGEFAKTAILCPAITAISPYASAADVDKYTDKNKADTAKVKKALFASRLFIPDEATWNTVSPLKLAPERLNHDSPDVYLSCGSSDEYGFYQGVAQFADLAYKNLNHFTWHPIFQGPHCAVDAGSVAKFLVK